MCVTTLHAHARLCLYHSIVHIYTSLMLSIVGEQEQTHWQTEFSYDINCNCRTDSSAFNVDLKLGDSLTS